MSADNRIFIYDSIFICAVELEAGWEGRKNLSVITFNIQEKRRENIRSHKKRDFSPPVRMHSTSNLLFFHIHIYLRRLHMLKCFPYFSFHKCILWFLLAIFSFARASCTGNNENLISLKGEIILFPRFFTASCFNVFACV